MNFTIHLYSVQSQRYGEEHLTFLWGHRNHTLIFQGWALHEFSPQQGNCIHSPDFISPLGTCILLHSLLWLGKVIGLGYHLEEDGVAPSPGHRWISVQFSRVRLFATPWTAAHEASLSITNSWSFLKLMSIKSVMPPNHLILCCPFLVLPSIFPSIRVFSKESVFHIRWPKFGVSASASVLPMNTQDWSPLGWTGWISLQSKGLQSLLQHHSSKSINSLALSFLYSPTLTSVHDYWKNHSFD